MPVAALLHALVPCVADLSLDLPATERYRRLLRALRKALPSDVLMLLRLDDQTLVPVAVEGLPAVQLSRQCPADTYLRLHERLQATGPGRLPLGTLTPCPEDNLLSPVPGILPVRDGMGCALYVQGQLWGLLVLASTQPGSFEAIPADTLATFARVTEATVRVATATPPEPTPAAGHGLRAAVDDFQRSHIRTALQRHDGNRAAAARELKLDRANLARLCRRLDLLPATPASPNGA